MAIIVLIKNELEELKVELGHSPIIIGRSNSCNVRVNDDQMSGKHCAIKVSSTTRILIKDLGTTNGTFLNESIVTDTNLMIDDVIRIGESTLSIIEDSLTPTEAKKLTKAEGLTKVRYMSLNSSEEDKKVLKPSEALKQKKELEEKKAQVASERAKEIKMKKKAEKKAQEERQELTLTVSKKNVRHSKTIKKIKKKQSLLSKLVNFFKSRD